MKTERQLLTETELANFTAAQLGQPMHDLDAEIIRHLTSESGHASPKSCLNDGNLWGSTLHDVVTGLVDSIFTLDGVLYDTAAELNAAL